MNDIEQPIRPVASAITIPRAIVMFVLVFGLSALAVRCVAVASQRNGGHGGHDKGSLAAAQAAGPALSLEQLAAKAGCTPKVQTNAAELRQGYCTTSSGRYFLTTFTTARGQQEWVEQAQDYGVLLVGNRWVVGASPQLLTQLRTKMGGEIYNHAHGH